MCPLGARLPLTLVCTSLALPCLGCFRPHDHWWTEGREGSCWREVADGWASTTAPHGLLGSTSVPIDLATFKSYPGGGKPCSLRTEAEGLCAFLRLALLPAHSCYSNFFCSATGPWVIVKHPHTLPPTSGALQVISAPGIPFPQCPPDPSFVSPHVAQMSPPNGDVTSLKWHLAFPPSCPFHFLACIIARYVTHRSVHCLFSVSPRCPPPHAPPTGV